MSLPGSVPAKLAEAFSNLPARAQDALLPHLLGDTSSEFLADWFARAGSPVGATTIKRYRRGLKEIR